MVIVFFCNEILNGLAKLIIIIELVSETGQKDRPVFVLLITRSPVPKLYFKK